MGSNCEVQGTVLDTSHPEPHNTVMRSGVVEGTQGTVGDEYIGDENLKMSKNIFHYC